MRVALSGWRLCFLSAVVEGLWSRVQWGVVERWGWGLGGDHPRAIAVLRRQLPVLWVLCPHPAQRADVVH